MNINVNDFVWVKLTAAGRRILERNYRDLNLHLVRPYEAPREEAGWARFQMWELMHEFGSSTYNGAIPAFETEIALDDPTQANGGADAAK